MRSLGTRPSLRVSRNRLVSLALLTRVAYAGSKTAGAILADDFAMIFAGGPGSSPFSMVGVEASTFSSPGFSSKNSYTALLFFPMTYTGVSPCQDFVLNGSLWFSLGILFRIRLLPKAFVKAVASMAVGKA